MEGTEVTWSVRGRAYGGLAWGAPDGVLTLYLHGFLDHAGAWARVAPAVGGWAVAPDHRGHGRSAWAAEGEDYFFPAYVADLDAIVHELVGPTAPVRIVGHSMGGTVGSLYAGARPERVAALVLVDGLGLYDQLGEAHWRMQAYLEGARRPPEARRMASIDEAARRIEAAYGALPEGDARALALRGTRPFEGGLAWAYDPRHRSRGALPYRQDQHRALLAEIRCPVLAVRPEKPVFAEADTVSLEDAVPRLTRVFIPGTGHMIHLEAPARLASEIQAFFQQHG